MVTAFDQVAYTDALAYAYLSATGTDLVIATTTAPVVTLTELRVELSMNDGGDTYTKYGVFSVTISVGGGADNTAPVLGAIADLSFELGEIQLTMLIRPLM